MYIDMGTERMNNVPRKLTVRVLQRVGGPGEPRSLVASCVHPPSLGADTRPRMIIAADHQPNILFNFFFRLQLPYKSSHPIIICTAAGCCTG